MKDAFFETIPPAGFGFAGATLDRLANRRDDAGFVAELRAAPGARFALIARDMPILGRQTRQAFWTHTLAERLGPPQAEILLGLDREGVPHFAALLPDEAVEQRADESDGFLDRRALFVPGRDDLEPVDMRSIAMQGLVPPEIVAILGEAKGIADWHARHRFCARCGQPTRLSAAGWRRECDVCKAQHFPRTDPVVIMLASDGERCLLGRSPRFVPGMWSCLAGFAEPGETIEDAVRRETREEAGIVTGRVSYYRSQPWPFPTSLMIGCYAEALSGDITVDREELEDARWFSRGEVETMLLRRHKDGLTTPPPMAIAHHIIRAWVDGEFRFD